ncbi:Phosphoenolpyruvate-dihydroxyacetone phosphotransferase, ADP-binding subunit DhaL [Candidatus Paraburkholderia calva]|nr:Phosphoenolpyruvate-dihydroxyacetone phosphotransferase, ADP-binding subunit DhaL [Candidatus Paraburkholderia calva]
MRALTTADMAHLFRELASTIAAARDELCCLDGVIGDADHSIAMEQGFTAASKAVDALPADATLADQLNAVGASSGPLYATAFVGADLPLSAAQGLIVAMAEGIRSRGKAEVGEKTMVDMWAPASTAAQQGMDDARPVAEIIGASSRSRAGGRRIDQIDGRHQGPLGASGRMQSRARGPRRGICRDGTRRDRERVGRT